MRRLLLVTLPLVLVACDQKPQAKAPLPSTPSAPPAGADKAKDPICGMFVLKAKSTKLTHEGAEYYFCSDNCAAKFKADPKKFAIHCLCANIKRQCPCDHCGGREPCDCVK